MRTEFIATSFLLSLVLAAIHFLWVPVSIFILLPIGALLLIGFFDYFQTKHTIRRNFPVLGRFRYMLEAIRPEINQYFVESNTDGKPFSREQRSVVYQRAKHVLDTIPFGTQLDVYQAGYEWVNHSLCPVHVDAKKLRVKVGNSGCRQPYDASILNISAMSYGALSSNAIMALNAGAKADGFAHNTGEGGISPHHLKNGGDLIWQIGTGYFGCRNEDGSFNADRFTENATRPEVRMIEIKLSQGAKPGHGGILPAVKVDQEISMIRGVPRGKDVISPPAHTAFSTPLELVDFIELLREKSGGKPVGLKLCLGKKQEFINMCRAFADRKIYPDYIAVDGSEGGTGAAPVEFANHMGTPIVDSLVFVQNALTGFDIRRHIKIIAAGKVTTGFGMVKLMSLGADLIYIARGMMLALGCIQALRCNANVCPAGVATTDASLASGLVPEDKAVRVASFHRETLESFAHILGSMGFEHPAALGPQCIKRRIDLSRSTDYSLIYHYLQPGQFFDSSCPEPFLKMVKNASPDSFAITSRFQLPR